MNNQSINIFDIKSDNVVEEDIFYNITTNLINGTTIDLDQ
jgi:hypothetical protein